MYLDVQGEGYEAECHRLMTLVLYMKYLTAA